MADSRRASTIQLQKMAVKMETQTRLIQFMASILISLFLTYLFKDDTFHAPQLYVLFLLFFSISLWITEAIPPFAVGIMIVGFLVFFLGRPEVAEMTDIDVTAFVNKWSDSVIWLLLGGFFLAEGLRKTGLDLKIFKLTISRFSENPVKLLLALMFVTAIASMVMSNTATTAMMLASITPLVYQVGKESPLSKAILLGVPGAAAIGGMGTIIGSPPNAVAVDAINRMDGIDFHIGFFEWMVFGVPIAMVLTTLFWLMLINRFKINNIVVDISVFTGQEREETDEEYIYGAERKLQRKIVLSVMGLTIFLWLTDGLHPIPMAAVSGIPIIALTMTSIISADDVRQLPWDTLMLVAGGLSLGLAIQETGIASNFVERLKDYQFPLMVMVGIFSMITVFAANVMSNTAAASILIPAAGLWPGIDPVVLPLIIGLSASCALFLPVSTPPNSIAFSTGMLQAKDFRMGGSLVGLGGPVLIIAWVLLLVHLWIS
ncbi:MAG TPA: DASS family sodium-coupled anion symporter [Saprospiraceae bacterium]|nr:DASS family sodium-coupled anion symporter [Saprospiraceae bacterium]